MLLSLNSFNKVKDFVNAITPLAIDVNLISGRYVVNAKSVMGIFSLDLSKPVVAVTTSIPSEEELGQIRSIMKKFEA